MCLEGALALHVSVNLQVVKLPAVKRQALIKKIHTNKHNHVSLQDYSLGWLGTLSTGRPLPRVPRLAINLEPTVTDILDSSSTVQCPLEPDEEIVEMVRLGLGLPEADAKAGASASTSRCVSTSSIFIISPF
mmetsp:Transcript_99414/g.171265  ORF Transcript_99414/g.171265 Transcript_99414/m.171265 type:complete len:132 (-) Transcript_99414:7-402(-)